MLDAAGDPLGGAITARDARAQDIATRTAIDPESCPEAAHYDAFHPAARLKWIGPQNPRALVHAAAVVDPKDFIAVRLTGRIASDPISLARLIAAATRRRSVTALPARPPETSCPTCSPAGRIDRVRANLRDPFDTLAGSPVVMASHDTWSGVLGLGALIPAAPTMFPARPRPSA